MPTITGQYQSQTNNTQFENQWITFYLKILDITTSINKALSKVQAIVFYAIVGISLVFGIVQIKSSHVSFGLVALLIVIYGLGILTVALKGSIELTCTILQEAVFQTINEIEEPTLIIDMENEDVLHHNDARTG